MQNKALWNDTLDDSEEWIIYEDHLYDKEFLNECQVAFKNLTVKQKFAGKFEDSQWIGDSGTGRTTLHFDFDEFEYYSYGHKYLKISKQDIDKMLRCFTLLLYGEYILTTIEERLKSIRLFLVKYDDLPYEVDASDNYMLRVFFDFIGINEEIKAEILSNFVIKKADAPRAREIKPFINYLVIENEINDLYAGLISDSDFIRWFPIYFWVKISFTHPLRLLEMLLTPIDCIQKKGDSYHLSIRNTMLKKDVSVKYDINKDYIIRHFIIDDTSIVDNIKKYLRLTSKQDRKFLFTFNDKSVNKYLTKKSFNHLLDEFINVFVKGNIKYQYAKYATNIDEFERVSGGDSRHLAMTNLYYNNVSIETIRQLAGHENIDTTVSYISNIKKAIWSSSIMVMQKKYNNNHKKMEELYFNKNALKSFYDHSYCNAEHDGLNGDLTDCIKEGHLQVSCFGCVHYRPSQKEIDEVLKNRELAMDETSKKMISIISKLLKEERNINFDKEILQIQTNISRYKEVCDINAEEVLKVWVEDTPMINC